MPMNIEYQKSVDLIDHGILALNAFKRTGQFDIELKERLINILYFLRLAKNNDYERLLYDKRISINRTHLESIHYKMNEKSLPEEAIQKAAQLLDKIGSESSLTTDETNQLQEYLFEISKPIWVTVNFDN